jgi:transposase-like protein
MALYNKREGTVLNKRWRCPKCRKEVSIKANTIFNDTHLPFDQVILLIYCFANAMSYDDAIREASIGDSRISPDTVAIKYKTCLACIDWVESQVNRGKIGGDTSVVEIDETLIGHRKNNRGRLVEGTWVLGIIDVHTNDFRIEVCPNNSRNAETLLPIIQNNVEVGTTIMSDCWPAYNELEAKGFNHLTVNHSRHYIDPDTWANTQKIESSWRAMKKRICRGGIPKERLGEHLCEYLWRRDVKHRCADLFTEMVTLKIYCTPH